jgi:hypothetical protein
MHEVIAAADDTGCEVCGGEQLGFSLVCEAVRGEGWVFRGAHKETRDLGGIRRRKTGR